MILNIVRKEKLNISITEYSLLPPKSDLIPHKMLIFDK